MGLPGKGFAEDYKRHAMGEWKERQAGREMRWAMDEGAMAAGQARIVDRCTFCNGKGWVYSGDLMKSVGDGRECPECVGGFPRVTNP